jgi:hypothetical protein
MSIGPRPYRMRVEPPAHQYNDEKYGPSGTDKEKRMIGGGGGGKLSFSAGSEISLQICKKSNALPASSTAIDHGSLIEQSLQSGKLAAPVSDNVMPAFDEKWNVDWKEVCTTLSLCVNMANEGNFVNEIDASSEQNVNPAELHSPTIERWCLEAIESEYCNEEYKELASKIFRRIAHDEGIRQVIQSWEPEPSVTNSDESSQFDDHAAQNAPMTIGNLFAPIENLNYSFSTSSNDDNIANPVGLQAMKVPHAGTLKNLDVPLWQPQAHQDLPPLVSNEVVGAVYQSFIKVTD